MRGFGSKGVNSPQQIDTKQQNETERIAPQHDKIELLPNVVFSVSKKE